MKTAQKAFWPILLVLSWIFAGFSVASAGGFGPAQGSSGGGSSGTTTATFNQVLTNANTTSGKDIVVSVGDRILNASGSLASPAISFSAGTSNGFSFNSGTITTSGILSQLYPAQVNSGARLSFTSYDDTAIAAGVGGGISFGGRTADTPSYGTFGGVYAAKDGTGPDSAASIYIWNCDSVSTVTNRVRITSTGSVITNAKGSTIAQNATDGFLYLPVCATGAPSGTPTSVTGAVPFVVGGDNHAYFWPGGTKTALIDAGGGAITGTLTLTGATVAGTPTWSSNQAITLSTASQPNVTSLGTVTGLTTAGTGQHTWATGGSPSASSPQIKGPTDAGLFITAGTSATVGRGVTISGAPATVGQTNAAAGGLVFDMGASTGNATEEISFNGPLTGSSGTSTNSSIALWKILNTGKLKCQSGHSGTGGSTIQLEGPDDGTFIVESGSAQSLSFHSQVGALQLSGATSVDLCISFATKLRMTNATPNVFGPISAGAVKLGGSNATSWGAIFLDYTNDTTAGTSVTINKPTGRFRKNTTGSTFTVTNSLVTAASHVFVNIQQNDTTATIAHVVPGAGSFVVTFNAAPTANIDCDFLVVNAD